MTRLEEQVLGYLAVTLPALALGFGGGMVSLKRSSRWCPGCGEPLRCIRCVGQPTPREALSRLGRRR